MIDAHFAILGAVVSLAGTATYAVATLRGGTEPNRISWGMWALAPMIGFAAELTQHVGLESLLTFAVGFGPLLVVLASFADPRAYARLTRLDLVCGGLSLAALIAWAITGTGDVAIAFSILSDFAAGIPTIRKAALAPQTENAVAFIGSGVGSVITLLTIAHWRLGSYGFPLYIAVMDATFTTLILFPRRGRAASRLGTPADETAQSVSTSKSQAAR